MQREEQLDSLQQQVESLRQELGQQQGEAEVAKGKAAGLEQKLEELQQRLQAQERRSSAERASAAESLRESFRVHSNTMFDQLTPGGMTPKGDVTPQAVSPLARSVQDAAALLQAAAAAGSGASQQQGGSDVQRRLSIQLKALGASYAISCGSSAGSSMDGLPQQLPMMLQQGQTACQSTHQAPGSSRASTQAHVLSTELSFLPDTVAAADAAPAELPASYSLQEQESFLCEAPPASAPAAYPLPHSESSEAGNQDAPCHELSACSSFASLAPGLEGPGPESHPLPKAPGSASGSAPSSRPGSATGLAGITRRPSAGARASRSPGRGASEPSLASSIAVARRSSGTIPSGRGASESTLPGSNSLGGVPPRHPDFLRSRRMLSSQEAAAAAGPGAKEAPAASAAATAAVPEKTLPPIVTSAGGVRAVAAPIPAKDTLPLKKLADATSPQRAFETNPRASPKFSDIKGRQAASVPLLPGNDGISAVDLSLSAMLAKQEGKGQPPVSQGQAAQRQQVAAAGLRSPRESLEQLPAGAAAQQQPGSTKKAAGAAGPASPRAALRASAGSAKGSIKKTGRWAAWAGQLGLSLCVLSALHSSAAAAPQQNHMACLWWHVTATASCCQRLLALQ